MFQLLTAIDEIHKILGMAAVIGVCVYAIALGSLPQKLAGVLQLGDQFGIALISAYLSHHDKMVVIDAKSVVVLVAYCALTIRWQDRSLILLAGLQGFAVLLHLAVWLDRSITIPVNGLLLNTTGWSMLLVLAAATTFRLLHPRRTAPIRQPT